MILWISAVAFAIVLVYFLILRKQGNDAWQRYLQRKRVRRRYPPPDRPIDPTFDFDQPPEGGEQPTRRNNDG